LTKRYTTIEIAKEYLHFSAAHFTIFSATERERLHGHNFFVAAKVKSEIGDNGLCFDYNELKDKLRTMCEQYDEYMLIPSDSPHLTVTEDGQHYQVTFNKEVLSYPKSDCKLLPVLNISVEELSRFLLSELLKDKRAIESMKLDEIELKVSSGPGQWGVANWSRS